ncbi:MAG: MFS transporter [Bacteroidaceae bacterium]|nr:MFS transporter [Bacteroidaceae bacterium]
MPHKLGNVHFLVICIANFFLFMSMYLLLSVLPWGMVGRLNVPIFQSGCYPLFVVAGMLLISPFHGHLVDAFRRRTVCFVGFVFVVLTTFGYMLVKEITIFYLLAFVQGVAFGMAAESGITLAIDIVQSSLRSRGNLKFQGFGVSGILVGIIAGVAVYKQLGMNFLMFASIASGVIGAIFVLGANVPFRAPIENSILSIDRFFLLRGWLPALNICLTAFAIGLLIPLAFTYWDSFINIGLLPQIYLLSGLLGGIVLSWLILRLFLNEKYKNYSVFLGLALLLLAFYLLNIRLYPVFIAFLMGCSLSIIIPRFLMMLISLSSHCERCTANTTTLLAWQIGLLVGVSVAYILNLSTVIYIGYSVVLFVLLIYMVATNHYFMKRKIR